MAIRTRSELAVALASAATFAAVLASYAAFRPVRDALVLDGDPDQLPWLFLGTFAAIAIVSPAWSAVLGRARPRRAVPRALHAFAACALGFAAIVRAGVAPLVVGRAFYVWSAVFNLFVVSVVWSLLADLLGPGTARRLYGPIAAGGTVGTLVGPWLTQHVVGAIGVAGVLAMSAALLELGALGVSWVRRAGARLAREEAARATSASSSSPSSSPSPPAAPADAPEVGGALAGGSALTGIAHVARSPYLRALVGYVLCTACAATFLYLAQARLVHAALAGREARTAFFASLDVWTALITLALQLAVARPALGWLGPGVVLCALPIAQAAGLGALALAPSLGVLAVAQVATRAATHGLTRPARELLFTVVSRDDKYRAKHAIDTVAYRLGDVAASWVHRGLIALGAGAGAIALVALPMIAGWAALGLALGAGFRRRLRAPDA